MKQRLKTLPCQMELTGVIAKQIPVRLVEISRSGCLLESLHRIQEGTVGALRLEAQGEKYFEDVRATRCVAVAGSGEPCFVRATRLTGYPYFFGSQHSYLAVA